jgi:hypothetical protein
MRKFMDGMIPMGRIVSKVIALPLKIRLAPNKSTGPLAK